MKETLMKQRSGLWIKGIITLASLVLLTLIFTASSQAAIPARVEVTLTPQPADKTQITIDWSGWEAGDKFERSTDGATWVTIVTPSGTTSDLTTYSFSTTGGNPNYVEDAFLNYNLVYFRITSSGSTKRINVYPPTENGHANYAEDTNKCSNCHLTHTAVGARLLNKASIKDLCDTCHGATGTGSRYNVAKGLVRYSSGGSPAYKKALGGPFSTPTSQWNDNRAISSSHDLEGPQKAAPGGTKSFSLSCIDCHNAHASNENYRLLNTTAAVYETFAKIAASGDFREQGVYITNGMNQFCKTCHPDFQRDKGSGHSTSDSVYRHATEVDLKWKPQEVEYTLSTTLPLYKNSVVDLAPNKIFCGTCHFAHGTTATGNNISTFSPDPGSTVLKRLDNMGICEDCHKK